MWENQKGGEHVGQREGKKSSHLLKGPERLNKYEVEEREEKIRRQERLITGERVAEEQGMIQKKQCTF